MKPAFFRLLFLLAPLATGVARAESPKASTTLPDELHTTITMYADEPVMHRALLRARRELPEFLELADTPPRHLQNFAVRVLLHQGQGKEYIWISNFRQVGEKSYSGFVDSEIHFPTQFKLGDPFTFVHLDIVDWTYTDTTKGRVYGAYTECALLTRAPKALADQIKSKRKLDCEF